MAKTNNKLSVNTQCAETVLAQAERATSAQELKKYAEELVKRAAVLVEKTEKVLAPVMRERNEELNGRPSVSGNWPPLFQHLGISLETIEYSLDSIELFLNHVDL